jgi:hypothetical protein
MSSLWHLADIVKRLADVRIWPLADISSIQTLSGRRRGIPFAPALRRSRDRAEQGEVAQRGDDGIHSETSLQDRENPPQNLEGYHADAFNDLLC